MRKGFRGQLESFKEYLEPKKIRANRHNPRPTIVRNTKIAANVEKMFQQWSIQNFPSTVTKTAPDPRSISSIKLEHRCRRGVARLIKARMFSEAVV